MHTQAPCRSSLPAGRPGALVSVALLLAACGSREDGAPDAEVEAVAERPAAACTLALDDAGRVTVDGEDTGVRFEGPGRVHLVVHATAPGERIVAFRPDSQDPPADEADDVLWRVTCPPRPEARRLLERPGAALGWSVPDPDGSRLYFTDARGASALDLATRHVRPITEAPAVDADCWAALQGGDRPRMQDRVVGFDAARHELEVYRGGPCGYEGDRVERELRIRHPDDPVRRRVRQVRPVAALALDADGRLWLGDAGRCHEPGVRDPSTPGAVWRSGDAGRTWERIPVRAAEHPMVTAAAGLHADPERTGRIAVYSALCESGGAILGGSVFLSEDGGGTWRLLDLPPDLEGGPASVGQGLAGAAWVGDVLVVWDEAGVVQVTPDLGHSWLVHAGPLPSPSRAAVGLDGATLRATDHGLVRVEEGREVRMFPPRP